jgi:hypothetical protein
VKSIMFLHCCKIIQIYHLHTDGTGALESVIFMDVVKLVHAYLGISTFCPVFFMAFCPVFFMAFCQRSKYEQCSR